MTNISSAIQRVLPRHASNGLRRAATSAAIHQPTTSSITAPISQTLRPRNSIASFGLVSAMMPRWCVEIPWP
jgi:hypothetical protein